MALGRHPVPEVEQRLQVLRMQGWRVTLSRNSTYFEITCKAGTMKTRITARKGRGLKGLTAREQLGLFLIRHNMKHPRE